MWFRHLKLAWLCCLTAASTAVNGQMPPPQGSEALRQYQTQSGGMFQAGAPGADLELGTSPGPVRINAATAPVVDRTGGVTLARPVRAEAPPTEFQKFVLESTGKLLLI